MRRSAEGGGAPPQATEDYRAGWLQALAEVAVWLDDYRGRSHVARQLGERVQRLAGQARRAPAAEVLRAPPRRAPQWSNPQTAAAAQRMTEDPAMLSSMRGASFYAQFLQLLAAEKRTAPLRAAGLDYEQLDELVADTPRQAGDAP